MQAKLTHKQEEVDAKLMTHKEKEQKSKKLEKVLDGTSQKLKIRKEELDKEWQRVDHLSKQTEQREAQIQHEWQALLKEKELLAAQSQE